uniref:Ig-like domain-containing protein n=1 Tax=Salarias fasciatus TaxID=181472 RepID=A0A672IQL1_SALFA
MMHVHDNHVLGANRHFLFSKLVVVQNLEEVCVSIFKFIHLLHKTEKIVSGHQPEFLGGTIGYDSPEVNQTPHFTTKQGPGTFILNIHQTQINDTGLYYCIHTSWSNMTFLRGVFLTVQGKVNFSPPSDAVHPGESVSLQCSVLSDSEKKTCSEDYRVHWFRAGSHQSHPSFIYTHGDNGECGNSSQKCFYNFSKKVNVSDAGTYYCAVAACGEVMFGNGTKLEMKGHDQQVQYQAKITELLISVILVNKAVTFVCLLAFLQTDEAVLTYSAPTFSRRKVTKSERGNTHSVQEETIYTDMLVHH